MFGERAGSIRTQDPNREHSQAAAEEDSRRKFKRIQAANLKTEGLRSEPQTSTHETSMNAVLSSSEHLMLKNSWRFLSMNSVLLVLKHVKFIDTV